MRSVFVAGTDTGVGKTVVAGALARTAALAGCSAIVFKPFMTGGVDDIVAAGAAGTTGMADKGDGHAAGRVASYYKYAFRTPASPYTAARLEGKTIDIGAVLDRLAQLRRDYEVVVVEGVGGVMTPLLRDYFVADLARDMVAPVVIVTANGFDAVGHSVMAESNCRRRGAHVAGFVTNRIRKYGYSLAALRHEINSVAEAPVLASVSKQPSGGEGGGGVDIVGMAMAPNAEMQFNAKSAARSAYAAICASEGGYVDGAARVIFGTGRGGPAERWLQQKRQRRQWRERGR